MSIESARPSKSTLSISIPRSPIAPQYFFIVHSILHINHSFLFYRRPTFVHRFVVKNTIEETIHRTISDDDSGKWASKQVTIDELEKLFALAQPPN